MNRLSLLTLCTLLAIFVASAQDPKKKDTKETVTFSIENMDCDGCVKKIEKQLAFEKGVTDIKCDLPTKTAKVSFRSDKTDAKKLIASLKKIGKIAKILPEEEKPDPKQKK